MYYKTKQEYFSTFFGLLIELMIVWDYVISEKQWYLVKKKKKWF